MPKDRREERAEQERQGETSRRVKDHVLRHVVTEPHPSVLDNRSHSPNHLRASHPLPPSDSLSTTPGSARLARLKPRRRQLTNADHGPSFTDTNKISPLFTHRHPRRPPSAARCTVAEGSLSRTTISYSPLLFTLFPRPPRGISHPTDRPAIRPLPARDYCPSTRNQLTGHPLQRSRLFLSSSSASSLSLFLAVCPDPSRRLFLRGSLPQRRGV